MITIIDPLFFPLVKKFGKIYTLSSLLMLNINLGANCTPEEVVSYTALFKEFCDVFAWSYEEMPGIDPSIVVHEIKTYPGAKPVRQNFARFIPRKSQL
jgi:hypothetical protein